MAEAIRRVLNSTSEMKAVRPRRVAQWISGFIYFLLKTGFFLAMPWGIWDLSSLTRIESTGPT